MIGKAFGSAWETFRADMGSWIAFFLVFALFATVAGSIVPIVGGLFLLPMAIRETTKSLEEERSPDLKQLWNFDHLGTDLTTMLFYAMAQIVGLLMCLVGWPFAWIGFWYTAELAADDRVSASDAMKLSWAYTKANLGETIGMALFGSLLTSLGASVGLGVGLLFTGPIVLLAWSAYWLAIREDVYAMAHEKGIHVKGEIQRQPALITHEVPVDIDLSHRGDLAHFQSKLDEDGSL